KSRFPSGADAQGVRLDHRSATAPKLHCELRSVRAFRRFVEAASALPEQRRALNHSKSRFLPQCRQLGGLKPHERRLSIVMLNWRLAGLAACAGVLLAATAYGQSPTALEQAELAGLSPELRAQVQARAVGGNSVTEVLQVMLLNNIKIKHPASQIVAMDWARGVAVVKLPRGGMQAVHFDPATLQIS